MFTLAERCPHCGAIFTRGTWRDSFDSLGASRFGWGLSPRVYQSLAFRLACLLVPVWVPPIVVILADRQPPGPPYALMLLLALFIFMPGTHIIANYTGWSRLVRFAASVTYIVASEVVTYLVLSHSLNLVRVYVR